MGYGTKYFAKVLDLDDKTTTINLKKKNYSGSTSQITHYAINPIALTYRSANKDDDLNVHGSEINFNFYSRENDNDKYDELFESELRDWQVEIIKQQNSLINTPIDLQTFENVGSGTNWSAYSTSSITSTVTSFFGSPAPTKRAIYPMYLDSGNTVSVNFAANFFDSGIAVATVTFTISLLDESKNLIIGSSVAKVLVESVATSINTTVVLTATTTNAHYISVQGLADYVSGTHDCTMRYTLLTPASRDFAPTGFWYGWINPDTLSRKWMSESYFINLQATDGLAELKSVDYPSSFIEASGTTYAINIIKAILSETDLPLPILSQLNYRTNNIGGSDSLLSELYVNSYRFVRDQKNGRKTYINCYDALSWLLKSFNCRISQVDATWNIVQKNEIESQLTTFDWDTLSYDKSNTDRLINIDDYYSKFDSDELQKVRPTKTINLTYLNKNVGEALVPNGLFLDNIDGWSGYNDGVGGIYSDLHFAEVEWSDGRLRAYMDEDVSGYDDLVNIGRYIIQSDPFYVDALGSSGSTLTISFDCEVGDWDMDQTGQSAAQPYRYTWMGLISAGTVTYNYISTNTNENKYYHTGLMKFTQTGELKFTESGWYQIHIVTTPDGLQYWHNLELFFDNVNVVQNYDSDITYDRLFQSEIAGQQFGKKQIEEEIWFSDGVQNNDVGNFKFEPFTGLTTTWSNDDNSVMDKSHQYLYCYEKMKMNRMFKNYLRITLKANSNINFNSVLELGDKYYYIIGYNYLMQTKDITLDLIELLTTDFTMNFSLKQNLKSIDGEIIEVNVPSVI